ncbi:methylenetetrahydrofolate reductase [NAD(P)H] [Nisaea sediminum]|uniref:methylenetetrahydrofolate reductase [NAD(P)H] n=1 Tax=Nisaea sediminum TaxID=2775867 RepID=UPI001866BFE8|nr:methylenetetrahydrofolate reductase [NAD(P)H] [Nisaea sediminum]
MTQDLNVSFEFFPPTSEAAEARLWNTVEKLAPLRPAFASVTYGAGGTTRERTLNIVRTLKRDGRMVPAAHLTCVGAEKAEIDAIARGWLDEGITHLVALRGDPPKGSGKYIPHPGGYANAAALVEGLRRIGDFDISVAAYPEAHPDSPSEAADIENLKAKINNGAARAITQYFFDAELFLRFRDKVAAAGIDVPIVPGIMPITNFGKTVNFSKACGATVPAWLHERFEGLDEDPETRELVAASTAADLCHDLMAEGVRDFHFYTLNVPSLTYAVCHLLGIRPDVSEAA